MYITEVAGMTWFLSGCGTKKKLGDLQIIQRGDNRQWTRDEINNTRNLDLFAGRRCPLANVSPFIYRHWALTRRNCDSNGDSKPIAARTRTTQ